MNIKTICGNCNTPASYHSYDTPATDHVVANIMGFELVCNVPFTDIGYRSWFDSYGNEVSDYLMVDGTVTVPVPTEGPAAGRDDDPYEPYVSQDDPSSEQAKIDRWSDNTHKVYTDANGHLVKTWVIETEEGPQLLKETHIAPDNIARSKEPLPRDFDEVSSRNAYVEGQDGFQSVQLIDELLTSKYHARLLNVYRDKQGFLRCGSIRFIPTTDLQGITARCVQSNCRATLTVAYDSPREVMQQFVLDVIRHGNNHAASWFVNRPTFYKVHDSRCILEHCDPKSPHCSVLGTTDHTLDPDDEVRYLLDHNSICSNSACKCAEILADLMPALARTH